MQSIQKGSRGRLICPKVYREAPLPDRFPSPSRYQIDNRAKCIPLTETEKEKIVSNWIIRGDYAIGDPSTWVEYPDEIVLLCDLPKEEQRVGHRTVMKAHGFGSQVGTENQAPDLQAEVKRRGLGFSTMQSSATRQPLAYLQNQVAVRAPTIREFMSTDRKLALEQLKVRNQTPISRLLPEPVPQSSADENMMEEEYDSNNSNDCTDFISESEVLTYAPYVMFHYPVIAEGFDNNDPYLEVY